HNPTHPKGGYKKLKLRALGQPRQLHRWHEKLRQPHFYGTATKILKTEKNFLLAVLPATYLVDFTKLKRLAKAKKISLAREEDMCKLFPDIEPGAMPPLGPLFGLPVFVDKTLSEKSEIVFNAGTHMELLKIRYKDFEKINKPVVGSFGKHV
ncbi:MAG: YbaK/EbsC family protein, partial [Candidatus Omnitrophica bacterium]|nr:YbaK/EbsC family protein [Candidatus Omnitrophota bacterium]